MGFYIGYDPDDKTDPYNPKCVVNLAKSITCIPTTGIDTIGLNVIPMSFRGYMAATIVVNSILTYFYEKVIIWHLTIWWKGKADKKKAREE